MYCPFDCFLQPIRIVGLLPFSIHSRTRTRLDQSWKIMCKLTLDDVEKWTRQQLLWLQLSPGILLSSNVQETSHIPGSSVF